jgi:hypothetical protein
MRQRANKNLQQRFWWPGFPCWSWSVRIFDNPGEKDEGRKNGESVGREGLWSSVNLRNAKLAKYGISLSPLIPFNMRQNAHISQSYTTCNDTEPQQPLSAFIRQRSLHPVNDDTNDRTSEHIKLAGNACFLQDWLRPIARGHL